MRQCKKCIYRNNSDAWGLDMGCCNYITKTGKSRVAAVYKQLGVNKLTKRAIEMLNNDCPCFCDTPPEPKPRPVYVPGGKQRRIPPEKIPKFMALYNQHLNDVKLGAAMGVCEMTARNWRHSLGLPSHFLNRIDWKKARQMYDSGATDRQIREVIGCSKSTLANWRRDNGLPANREDRHGKK